MLRIVGFAGYGTVFLSGLILTGYYSGHRPRFPQPEKGWTTHLRWSFNQPTYGAQTDDRNELLLFDLGFPFLFIGLLGEGIRKVNERNEPWKAK
ncbi:MAG: hypothetical protein WB949_09495 [Candidatus Acidiferrales bacterium]